MSDVCEQRLKKFPSIISGDAKELKRFAELLEKSSVIVKDIRCYSNLDSLDTLTLLVKKLPYNLRTRWVKRAVQVENRSGKLANFSHFSEFVQLESEETNSLFGLRSLNVKPSTSKVKASYTTTSFNSSNREWKPRNRWGECWYCKSSTHRLIECEEFIKISIDDRFEFIKRSKLCHKCFSSRHRTPQCKKVNSCTVEGCTNPFHHTLLHFTRKRSPVSKRTAPEISNLNTDNPPENTIALSTVSKATDSDANVYLCVVPVRVKYEEKEVLTYAFLDQGSTHTFCDKPLIQSLGITGRSEKICLQTLAGSVKGYDGISCELEVSGLDGKVYYTIPNVFSINEIPVRPNLVSTQRKILELPHLKGIKLDILSNVEVGLLIGVDVPELFCTSEFRKGPRGTPSAIYTPLGWSLLGPSLSPSYSTNCKVHFSRKTDDAAYQLIESLWDSKFVKGTTVLDIPNSKEDRAAFHLMQDSVTIHKGHYQLPLLWRHSSKSSQQLCDSKAQTRSFKA